MFFLFLTSSVLLTPMFVCHVFSNFGVLVFLRLANVYRRFSVQTAKYIRHSYKLRSLEREKENTKLILLIAPLVPFAR